MAKKSFVAVVGLFVTGLFWVAPTTRALPQEIESTVTLDQVMETALRQNAQLRSLRVNWEAMQERPAQEGALPNPMFQYGGMDAIDGGSWPNTNEKRFAVEQPLPWFGKRGLMKKAAGKEAEATGREYDAMMRDVIMMVKESYFELYSVQQSLSITRGEQDVLEQMQKIAEIRYATGGANQQDAIKAQAEVSMLQARVLELEQEEVALKAKLNQLLNRPADSPFGQAVTTPRRKFEFEARDLFDLAEKTRPEIKQAHLEIESSEYRRDLMRKESFPDYRLGVEYRSFREGDDMVMFMLGLDLPIWRTKYRAGVREAEKMIESQKAGLEAVEKQVSFDVQDAHSKLLTGERIANLYETALIPQAQARFEASEAGYRTGKVDFLDLLESERFLLNARVMYAMAEGQLGVLLARLERAVGTDLENGIPPQPPAPERQNEE